VEYVKGDNLFGSLLGTIACVKYF